MAAGVSYLGGGLLLDATSAPTTFLAVGAAGSVITVLVAVALHAPGARAVDHTG